MPIDFVLSEEPSSADRDAILAELRAYNDAQVGPSAFQSMAILLKDADGKVLGGLMGRSGYDWLFVELVVVPQALRGKDVGTELMQRAEAWARARGCVGVRLDTFSFQAPDFYRKLGYRVVGVIDEHPRGAQRVFLCKYLENQPPTNSSRA